MRCMALRIFFQFVLTIVLLWAMNLYMGAYVAVTGGWAGLVIIGALLTLMNLFVRPLLNVITLPLKFFATVLAIILVNGGFLWLTLWITARMDSSIVTMEIRGGVMGWILVAVVLGIANAIMKEMLKKRHE